MIRKLLFAFLIFALTSSISSAQQLDTALYFSNDRLIDSQMTAKNYADAVKTIENQLAYLKSINQHDSIYSYTYKYGTCHYKLLGEEGLKKSEQFFEYVKSIDSDTTHWLEAQNDLAWIYYESGNAEKCFEADKAYLELCKNYKSVTPFQLFTAHYSLSYDYLDLGNSLAASYHVQQGLDALPENDTLYTLKWINGYNLLGSTLWRSGDLKSAKAAYEQSLHHIEKLSDPYEILRNKCNALGNLGIIAQDDGDLVLAKDLYTKSLENRKKAMAICTDTQELNEHNRLILVGYRNLASLYLAIGDMSRALQITHYINDTQEKILGPNDPRKSLNYEAFGGIHLALGDLDKSLSNFIIYKDLCELNYGKESYHTGRAYRRIGEVYSERKMLNEAVESFNEAIACFKNIDDKEESLELASVYRHRAIAYQSLKNYDLAIKDIANTVEIYQKTRDDYNPKHGDALTILADLYLANNNPELALKTANQAIEILNSYQENVKRSGNFQLNNPVQYLPNAFYTKAKIHYQNAANEEDLKATIENIDNAIKLLNESKNTFDSEDAKIVIYQYHDHIFNFAQDLSFTNFQKTGDSRYLIKMFELEEESRTILLRKQLSNFGSLKYHNIPDSIQQEEKYLLSILSGKTTSPDSTLTPVDYEQKYNSLILYIKENHPDYYQFKFEDQIIEFDKLKAELVNENQSLIQYIRTNDFLYALVLTAEKNHLIKLDSENITKLVENYVQTIKQPKLKPFIESSQALYNAVFSSVQPLINTTNLYIIPDDELMSINFETLIKPNGSSKPHYLIYDYNISYLLSATTAFQSNHLKRDRSGKLLALAPGFSDELKTEYLSAHTDTVLRDEHFLNCIQQPFAVRAATNAATVFPGNLFTGKKATEKCFKENASEYGIIHFGTHTEINNTTPMLSRLILSKEENGSTYEEDGYLHAYEIYNLPLRAELAVLTACETGVGKQQKSEGVRSLAHCFAYAGCPSIVMSLWQIDEKTSSFIIEDFYKNLADGMPKNTALREAKLTYLKSANDEMSAPYFWAGMVLVGNTDPIVKSSPSYFWWLIPVIILVLLLAFFGYRRFSASSKAQ
jgi:CHAT domain-containing protein